MPQIADLEIAATWDEIELEAALRGRSAEAQTASSMETTSSLSEALRAIEELRRLPKAERKRRAEELLRALTNAPPAAAPQQGAVPDLSEPIPAAEPACAGPVAVAPEISELPAQDPPSAEITAGPSPEIMQPLAPPAQESSSAETAPGMVPDIAQLLSAKPPATASPTSAAPITAVPVQGSLEPCASTSIADVAAVQDSATKPKTIARVAEPARADATEPSPLPVAAAEPYSIPKFLTTKCPSLEPEHPDSLIPFPTVAAACALVGAVLLIYFGSSQEFGVAARPLAGMGLLAEPRAAPPEIPPSVAVRQAFVTEPPAYSAASEPVRSYRAPFVGFDFLDAAVPVQASAAEAEPSPPQPQIVPQSHTEETAILPPPAPDADFAALIKRGDALLKAGDIAAARSAYARAAAGGSAKGAIGVGKTYDPLVLAKLGARGVRADAVQAASWYARAGEAGDEEGQQRLDALISGLSDCMLTQGACTPRKP